MMPTSEKSDEISLYQKEISNLRLEISKLIKICEDVVNDRSNMFHDKNIILLIKEINSHKEKVYTRIFDNLICSISDKFSNGEIDAYFMKQFGSILEDIGLVDAEWYLSVNSDVALAGYGAGYHYVWWGYQENRLPNEFHPAFQYKEAK